MATQKSPPAQSATPEKNVHYTTVIRLPFPRRDFVDPPLVNWDKSKEKTLWKILSRAPRSADLDWKELATKFDVTLPFILQQAAAMYERQLSQMREQMRKASKQNKAQSSTGSVEKQQPNLAGGQAMQRQGSSDTSRPRSFVEMESPLPSSSSATPRVGSAASREHPLTKRTAPPMSRNPSNNTVIPSRPLQPSSPGPQAGSTTQTPVQRSPRAENTASPGRRGTGMSDGQDSSSSSEDSDEDDSASEQTSSKILSKSQVFRRAPRFAAGRKVVQMRSQLGFGNRQEAGGENKLDSEEDEDEEDETPAFLPLGVSEEEQKQQDLGATLRKAPQAQQIAEPDSRGVSKITSRTDMNSSVSSESTSSLAAPVAILGEPAQSQNRVTAGLNQHRPPEPAYSSPKRRNTGKDGSEGSPGIGSSFSDLDDASVTQSALEEALNSNMQHGGGSRMSNLS